jgi:hypothetical protein
MPTSNGFLRSGGHAREVTPQYARARCVCLRPSAGDGMAFGHTQTKFHFTIHSQPIVLEWSPFADFTAEPLISLQ